MAKFILRAFGNYDADAVSAATGLEFDPDEGMTHQSFKDECDINTIVARFGLTGELPGDFRMPVSGDFTGVTDFHTAMNMVRDAQDNFMRMPAELRKRFGNDPQVLMEFLEDANNKDEAIKLGLIDKPVEKTRDAVQAIDELASKIVPKV